jgi:hypothetical protein
MIYIDIDWHYHHYWHHCTYTHKEKTVRDSCSMMSYRQSENGYFRFTYHFHDNDLR